MQALELLQTRIFIGRKQNSQQKRVFASTTPLLFEL